MLTPLRRDREEGLIDMTASCDVGTGPGLRQGDLDDDARLGFSIVTSEAIEEHRVEAAIERILTRIGDAPLYVSIDVTCSTPRMRQASEPLRPAASPAGVAEGPVRRFPVPDQARAKCSSSA